LDELPPEILIIIFGHLPFKFLLCTISRVCKKFHNLVDNAALWENIEFEYPIELDEFTLKRILAPNKLSHLRKLSIPEALSWDSPEVDQGLFPLSEAKLLNFLDLTGVSSLVKYWT
jgi:hypothetical protein